MRKLLAITATLALAACGGSDTTTIETEDGTAEYTVDSDDDGDAEIRFTDGDGNETVISTGSDTETELPDGFSLYPGAEVASNTVMSGEQGQGSMVGFTSAASPDELAAHYRAEAEAAGFDIQMEMKTGDTIMIGGEGPDNGFFSLNASAEGDGSSAMLIVGQQ